MRRINKEVNGERYILETFESFDEILRTCDKREVKSAVSDETRNRNNESEFMGCSSYDEAVKLLKHGYTKNIEKMKSKIKEKEMEKKGEVQKVSFKNDIVGYAPIVPLAIQGVPNCMINNVRVQKKSKVVTIVVDMAVSWRITKEKVFEYGCKVVQKLIQLEQSGFRVRLEYLKCFNDRLNHTACATVIKHENQPLDLKRIMFPLTNVSMQRYISWDWYDRVPEAYWDDGRGESLSVLSRSRRKEITDVLVSDSKSKYIVCYGDDLDEVLKEVK